MAGLDEGTPLFVQVAERLAAEIADGGLAEGERVPSTNELAAYYRINPATAAKGINVLAGEGLLEKHRGIGMFVAAGARAVLLEQRRRRFAERYVAPLVTEATRLGISTDELVGLILESSDAEEAPGHADHERGHAGHADRGPSDAGHTSRAGHPPSHAQEGINA